MNLKKSIVIAFAAMAVASPLAIGSAAAPANPIDEAVSTPQEAPLTEAEIQRLFKLMTSKEIEARLEAAPIDKLPGYAIMRTPLWDTRDMCMDQYLNRRKPSRGLIISDLKPEGNWGTARVSYIDTDNKRYSQLLFFRRLEGKWVVDPSSIKTTREMKISGFDAAKLEVAANLGYTYKNEPVLVIDMRSITATRFSAGWVSRAGFVLVTDEGEFPIQNTDYLDGPRGPIFISSDRPSRFCLPFKGATGTPRALRITGFNELDNIGLPARGGRDQEVTFTLSE